MLPRCQARKLMAYAAAERTILRRNIYVGLDTGFLGSWGASRRWSVWALSHRLYIGRGMNGFLGSLIVGRLDVFCESGVARARVIGACLLEHDFFSRGFDEDGMLLRSLARGFCDHMLLTLHVCVHRLFQPNARPGAKSTHRTQASQSDHPLAPKQTTNLGQFLC